MKIKSLSVLYRFGTWIACSTALDANRRKIQIHKGYENRLGMSAGTPSDSAVVTVGVQTRIECELIAATVVQNTLLPKPAPFPASRDTVGTSTLHTL